MHAERNQSALEPTKPKQLRTKYERGIYRRQTRDGKTRWEIAYTDRSGKQRWETVASLAEARTRRAELVSKPVDERVGPSRVLFAEFAESWLDGRVKVQPRTRAYNRPALDLVLIPRFGRCRLAAIDADAIVKLTRDLEREGLHALDQERPVRGLSASSVSNYLKPLQGILALAVRRRLLASNPFDVLLPDDRPLRAEAAPAFVWSTEAVDALLAAAERIAQRNSRRPTTHRCCVSPRRSGCASAKCWGCSGRTSTRPPTTAPVCCTFGGSGWRRGRTAPRRRRRRSGRSRCRPM